MSPPGTQRALVRTAAGAALARVPVPRPQRADDVIIEVVCAAICRTDLHAAAGRLPVPDGRVLGHELAGRVVEAGDAAARGFPPGTAVAVMPRWGCGACAGCAARGEGGCLHPVRLGREADGAFAERVRVPARAIAALPGGMPFDLAALAEPAAAALAVGQAGLALDARGCVVGAGRIAELTRRALARLGAREVVTPAQVADAPGLCAWAVETEGTALAFAQALAAVGPGGTVVLRARPPEPLPLDVADAVERGLTLRGVRHAPLADALRALADGSLPTRDLIGPTYPLTAWADAFACAARPGAPKILLSVA